MREALRPTSSVWPLRAVRIGWALADYELDADCRLSDRRFEPLSHRGRGWGGGWAERSLRTLPSPATRLLALAELQALSLARSKRRARAFGQPFGLPESLSLACPRESNQREGHPSSTPSAHPCAEGSRVSAGVRGQCIPALSRTSPASLPAPLRADRPSLAAPQGPREERGLLPAGATSGECVGLRIAAEAQAQAAACCARP